MQISSITLRYATLLGFVVLVCAAISSGVYFMVKDKIDVTIEQQKDALFRELIPNNFADNDILASCVELSAAPNIGIKKLYFTKKNDNTVGYIIETTAPDGYSGKIELLMAMNTEGKILGVRTITHKETPGLGDKIETRISDWIFSFNNKILDTANLSAFAVKKDGGEFDQFAGATITPRAVVNQVKQTALFAINELTANTTKLTHCH